MKIRICIEADSIHAAIGLLKVYLQELEDGPILCSSGGSGCTGTMKLEDTTVQEEPDKKGDEA